ncbi:MAG: DNA-directed RNA polymerase subunit RpoH/Rpb5 C-terminal domain-containing protein, partial [Sulfitobacter sp.]|nr:DNA-directed RNA polymerase subunit RpoH/Rpb5 C-terminal domain-containing protein [Sulfitobacter sp.]
MATSNESLAGVNALHFIKFRGWELLEETFKPLADKDKPTSHEMVEQMLSKIGYWNIVAKAGGALAAIVVARQQSLPDFRKIINGVLSRSVDGQKIGHLVLISPAEMVGDQKFRSFLRGLRDEGLRVEMVSNVKFAANLPELPQVPKHHLMAEAEVEAYLEANRLKRADLPAIKSNDAMAIWLGAVPGNVVMILRDSETSC